MLTHSVEAMFIIKSMGESNDFTHIHHARIYSSENTVLNHKHVHKMKNLYMVPFWRSGCNSASTLQSNELYCNTTLDH